MKTLLFGLLCITVLLGGCSSDKQKGIITCDSSTGPFTGVLSDNMLIITEGQEITYERFLCTPTVSDQKF